MNNKEEEIIKEINDYFIHNKDMPTIRFLQKKLNYRSPNAIYYYFKSLEKKGYLIRNTNNQLVIDECGLNYQKSIKKINVINRKGLYVNLFLNKNKNYLAYQLNNDYFISDCILRNDILVIQTDKNISNNDLGLFIINGKYKIMKYNYKDGFYILKDKEEIILNRIKLIGKVIFIERKK